MRGRGYWNDFIAILIAALAVIAAIVALNVTGAHGQAAPGVAIIGDSLSDEYRADDNRGGTYGATTFNWLEVLVQLRGLDAGAWGNWGGQQRSGYRHNWSRSGATTDSMVAAGVPASVASQVVAGQVSYLLVMLGPNDFSPSFSTLHNEIYNGTLVEPALSTRLNAIHDRIINTIDTIRSAGTVRVVLSTIIGEGLDHIPVTSAEKTSYLAAYPDGMKRERVFGAQKYVNDRLKLSAATRGVALFDVNAYFVALTIETQANGGALVIGGQRIEANIKGNDPHHMLLGDQWFHPGTVFAGRLANAMFVEPFNACCALGLAPLTDSELLQLAGIQAVPTVTPTPTATNTPVPTATATPLPTATPGVCPCLTPTPMACP